MKAKKPVFDTEKLESQLTLAQLQQKDEEAHKQLCDAKLKMLEQWLEAHNVKGVKDRVFDGQGVIVQISRGMFDIFSIKITPLGMNHNLGAGYGNTVVIEF